MIIRNTPTSGRALAIAAALVLALAPALAEARSGKGSSSGSRGSRTDSAPAATTTAPGAAQSFQRSAGPSQAAPAPGAAMNRPAAPQPAAGGMFSSPLAKGILGGLIGAGIFGLLAGSGLFSGLNGLAGFFGLLLQLALIGGLAWLAVSWWRRRQQPAAATAAPGYDRQATPPQAEIPPVGGAQARSPLDRLSGMSGLGGGAGASFGGGSAFSQQTTPLQLDGADFDAFESLLAQIQQAYANEDVGYLRRIATAEMAGYFADDLAEQRAKGLVAKSGSVKLLQGDLSEAWGEQSGEYATVAMRYEMIDALVEEATGKVVEGDLHKLQEITELWTFVRPHGSGPRGWALSAIQQVEQAA